MNSKGWRAGLQRQSSEEHQSRHSQHSSFFQFGSKRISTRSDKSVSVQFLGRSARVENYENEMRKEERTHIAQVNTVEFLVDDPVACGFLKFYCELQFNVENVYFVVEVGKFKDIFAVDGAAWGTKDWKSIDRDVGLQSLPSIEQDKVPELLAELRTRKLFWPSTIVSLSEVEQKMSFLWNSFLSRTAEHEICAPAAVFQNTMKRLFLVHIYGPRVFDEALLDPLKTLKKDIYPRFIVSDLALEMQKRLDMTVQLPTTDQLFVPPPQQYLICDAINNTTVTIDKIIENLTLAQTLLDKVIYENFLHYLQSIVSQENLLCIRMIEFFKEQTPVVNQSQPRVAGGSTGLSAGIESYYHFESTHRAWIVYLFFVHPGSAYEVALSHRRRKDIRLSMANPPNNCFDRLEKSALDATKVHFQEYLKSGAWRRKLADDIQKHLDEVAALVEEERRKNRKSRLFCCFGSK